MSFFFKTKPMSSRIVFWKKGNLLYSRSLAFYVSQKKTQNKKKKKKNKKKKKKKKKTTTKPPQTFQMLSAFIYSQQVKN